MACDIDDREGKSPSPMEPRLGRMFHNSATGRRREHTISETFGLCQAASPTGWHRAKIGVRLGNQPLQIDSSPAILFRAVAPHMPDLQVIRAI
jgi:hypothetical protein